MVYANSRNSKNPVITAGELSHLAITSWHFHTELLPGESLSSWIVRAGLKHAIEPMGLGRIIWGEWRAWTRDIDRWLPNRRLEELSQALKIPRETLYLVTLTPWVRQMSLSPIHPNQRWFWVSSISHKNRSRRSSFAFCPLCLAEDKIPYMRKSWRFSWVTACPVHKVLLREACPHCDFPIHLSKHTLSSSNFRYCTSCHGDLSSTTEPPLAETSVHASQVELTNALYAGQPVAQNFATLRFLIHLIRKSLISTRHSERSPLSNLIDLTPGKRSPLCSIAFPELSISDRHALLNAAFKLLALKESHFVDLLVQSGVTQSFFLKDISVLSDSMLRVSKQLPCTKRERVKNREVSKQWPAPRSPDATRRLMNVLYRSIRVHGK